MAPMDASAGGLVSMKAAAGPVERMHENTHYVLDAFIWRRGAGGTAWRQMLT